MTRPSHLIWSYPRVVQCIKFLSIVLLHLVFPFFLQPPAFREAANKRSSEGRTGSVFGAPVPTVVGSNEDGPAEAGRR